MRTLFFVLPAAALLAQLPLLGQTATLSLASATAAAETTASLNLSLSNSSAVGGVSALQFSIAFSPADFTAVTAAAGSASTGRNKSLRCRASSGRLDCMVWGNNATEIGDGVVAVLSATPSPSSTAGTRTLTVGGVTAARASGALTSPLSVTNGVVTVPPPPAPVTLSGLACAPSMVSAASSTVCTVTLSGNAPSATAVSITRNTTRITVPSTVTVAAGQSSASFTATTGSFTTASTGTITATLSGVSRSFSLSLVPLPVLQSLACTPLTLFSGESASCTVTLSAAALSNLAVSLSKDSALVTMPALVTVPAGSATASFTATVGTISADSVANLNAAFNGASRTVTLSLSAPPVPVSLECTPGVINPGQASSCRVTLSKAPNASTSVAITRSSTLLTVPTSVTVAAGTVSATFNATAKSSVTSLINVEVRATLNTVRVTANVTISTRSCPCSLFDPATAVPETISHSDTAAVELGMKFRSQLDGFVIGVRFYKGPANTGTHSGRLWTASGTQLASVTFTDETPSGWQTAYFPTPVPIVKDTMYVISYRAPVGRYSINTNFFANTAHTRAPLVAGSSWETGGNGVYRYGAIAFPTSVYLSSNYWVDVIFNTSPSTAITAIPLSGAAANSGVLVSSLTAPKPISVPEEEYRQPGEAADFIAASPAGGPLTVRNLPPGAAYDAVSREFRWTPEPGQTGEHEIVFEDQESGQVSSTRVIVGADSPVATSATACANGVASIFGRWLGPDADEYEDWSGTSMELAGVRVRAAGWEVPVLRVRRNRVDYLCDDVPLAMDSRVLVETSRGVSEARIGTSAAKASPGGQNPKN